MGDFSAHFHRPAAGIHTVEGTVAGARAAALTQKRQRQQEEFEQKERAIRRKKDNNNKFQPKSNTSEEAFRSKTVGLVTAEEFRRATEEQGRKEACKDGTEETTAVSPQEQARLDKIRKKEKRRKQKEKRKQLSTLSFAQPDDDEGDELLMGRDDNDNGDENELFTKTTTPTLTTFKDPSVDTSFLPDKQREERQVLERKRLEQEWQAKQDEAKRRPLEIVYSYWDGSGHRRSVTCVQGDTIGDFLELVRKDLVRDFRELQNVSSDALVYVKEDLILPHDLTFYDLIATRARGKSGPLFHFDVRDDVRVGAIDVRVEKDESHPGKVVARQWYDRNKHIFPASRWEVFDPAKDYGAYTIHGGEVSKKK